MGGVYSARGHNALSRRGLLGGLAATAVGAAILTRTEAASAAGDAPAANEYVADIAVVGGGVGGVAAALGALRNGARVVLTEESDWIGGQFTTQLVPADEHYWIEPSAGGYGQTTAYRQLRIAVRQYYKDYYPVNAAFKSQSQGNPGNAWASRIAADPAVMRACMWGFLAPFQSSGKLTVLLKHRPASASLNAGKIQCVAFFGPDGVRRNVVARQFIDATETGDLLPLTGCAHTVGRESGTETGELHNESTAPEPMDQQAFTMVMAVGYNRAGGDYRIAKPTGYEALKPEFDAFFAENLFDPRRDYPWAEGRNFWQYRRVAAHSTFTPGAFAEEVSLLNFPVNDYRSGNLVGVDVATTSTNLRAAKDLSLSMLFYLQNDIPHVGGDGSGYPALRPRPDVSGTPDGLAMRPYIREGRRMKALGRVLEWHVGVDDRLARTGLPEGVATAYQFPDSVGTGHYWLDLHGGPMDFHRLWLRCFTYQIPLMALISPNVSNLLAGGKALGTTHITNGAYRLHPTEWSVGEAAGSFAAFCVRKGKDPKSARASLLGDFRNGVLAPQGVRWDWPPALRTKWQT